MAIAIVNETEYQGAAGSSHPITVPATTVGNYLVALISRGAGPSTTVSSMSGGGTWAEQAKGGVSGSNNACHVWSAECTSSVTSITITPSTSVRVSATILELSGVDLADPIEATTGSGTTNGTHNDNTSDTTWNCGSLTTATADSFLCYIVNTTLSNGNGANSVTAGYTLQSDLNHTSTLQMLAVVTRNGVGAGTYAPAITGSNSATNGLAAIAINASAGGGPTTVTPPVATATAQANSPTVRITLLPVAATATGQAPNAPSPTVTVKITVAPPTATATGAATLPILVGENLTRVTPPTAEATGSANNPTVAVRPTPPAATATGQAANPTLLIRPTPPVATATGQANAPVFRLTLTPGTASATGVATLPTVRVVVKPPAATATGSAPNTFTIITPAAPTTFLGGVGFLAYPVEGQGLAPQPVIIIPGSSLVAEALTGAGFEIVPVVGGASYTTVSLLGVSLVETD